MKDKRTQIEYIEEEETQGAGERIKKLQKALKSCKAERQEYLEGWQRTRADQQNYIKQKEREAQEFKKFVSENILLQIIPILDNLVLALDAVSEDIKDHSWTKGVAHIKKQAENILAENGVEEIHTRRGDIFDPAFHEAAEETQSPQAGGDERGTIIEVLQRGYMLNGKVIRAARVRVVA